LMNLFGIGGVGVMQAVSSRVHASVSPVPVEAPYQAIFLLFGGLVIAGSVIYLFSQDRTD